MAKAAGCRCGWPPKSLVRKPVTTRSALQPIIDGEQIKLVGELDDAGKGDLLEALPRCSFPSIGRSPSVWS